MNPLRSQRLLLGWTQAELAAAAGITPDNVLRNEQGLFNQPSPKLLATLVDHTGDNAIEILAQYLNWISWRRRQEPIRSYVLKTINFRTARELSDHPFKLWRQAITGSDSRIKACQMLCVHPATMLKYEKGQQRQMPSQIYAALIETGMPKPKILELAKISAEYYEVLREYRTN